MHPEPDHPPPGGPPTMDELDPISLVEYWASTVSDSYRQTGEFLDRLLAAEAVRMLTYIFVESNRIADSVEQIALDHGQVAEDIHHLVTLSIPSTVDRFAAELAHFFKHTNQCTIAESTLTREMLRQAGMDFVFVGRDIVGILSKVLKQVTPPKDEDVPPADLST